MNIDANVWFYISLSIVFPLLVGLYKFKKIDSNNYPFIFFITVGFINELLYYFIESQILKSIICNIYLLLEFSLLAWQFYLWHIIVTKQKLYLIILFSAIIYGITLFIYSSFHVFNSYFFIYYSFLFVFIILDYFNRKLFKRNSYTFDYKVLVCIALFVFYVQSILIETFFAYGINLSETFQINIQYIRSITNFITNILFGFAILWIPRKQIYI